MPLGAGLVVAAPSGAPLETLPSEEHGPRPFRPAPRPLPEAAKTTTSVTARDGEDEGAVGAWGGADNWTVLSLL